MPESDDWLLSVFVNDEILQEYVHKNEVYVSGDICLDVAYKVTLPTGEVSIFNLDFFIFMYAMYALHVCVCICVCVSVCAYVLPHKMTNPH